MEKTNLVLNIFMHFLVLGIYLSIYSKLNVSNGENNYLLMLENKSYILKYFNKLIFQENAYFCLHDLVK